MMASTPVQTPQVHFGAAPNLYTALHGQPSSTTGYAGSGDWFLDTSASTHMATYPGIQDCRPISSDSTHIIVGNGAPLPVTHTGATSFPTNTEPLHLKNVLVCPSLIKNLVSVRALTRDNPVTVEFDAFGFSIKDLQTRTVLLRCDSSGELYPLRASSTAHHNFAVDTSSALWHARLGHISNSSLSTLLQTFPFSCSRLDDHSCHACRLGKHVRLPFASSNKVAGRAFELLHCDLWTSPVISNSGYRYYLAILDDHTHFVWTFPLRQKSEVLPTLICFHAFVRTQFCTTIASLQTDNGKEFDNHALRSFLATNSIILRLTCPYTSQQNGRAERVLRTLNDSVRAMLFHADVLARGPEYRHSHAQSPPLSSTQQQHTLPAPPRASTILRSLARVRVPVLSQSQRHSRSQALAALCGVYLPWLPCRDQGVSVLQPHH
jgi:histone deacetylase 1/2